MNSDSRDIDYLNPNELLNWIENAKIELDCEIAFIGVNKNDLSMTIDRDKFYLVKDKLNKLLTYNEVYHKMNRRLELQELYGIETELINNVVPIMVRYFEYILVLFIKKEIGHEEVNKCRRKIRFWNNIFNMNHWRRISSIGLFCDVNHGYATAVGSDKIKILRCS